MLKRRYPQAAEHYDCRRCKESLADDQRQLKGCGYLPRLPGIDLPGRVWDGAGLGRMASPDEFVRDSETDELVRDDAGRLRVLDPVCPGYVCQLPEVVEAQRAHWFAKNGGLLQLPDRPTEGLLDAIVVLENEYGAVLVWVAKNPEPQ